MSTAQRAPIGRPRGFDADQALDRALEIFWRQGYEGASLSDLTEAMGITKTSMYAAFGNKRDLFDKALARYAEVDMAYLRAALAAPTARQVAETFLRENVKAAGVRLDDVLMRRKGASPTASDFCRSPTISAPPSTASRAARDS